MFTNLDPLVLMGVHPYTSQNGRAGVYYEFGNPRRYERLRFFKSFQTVANARDLTEDDVNTEFQPGKLIFYVGQNGHVNFVGVNS